MSTVNLFDTKSPDSINQQSIKDVRSLSFFCPLTNYWLQGSLGTRGLAHKGVRVGWVFVINILATIGTEPENTNDRNDHKFEKKMVTVGLLNK